MISFIVAVNNKINSIQLIPLQHDSNSFFLKLLKIKVRRVKENIIVRPPPKKVTVDCLRKKKCLL